MIGSVGKRRVYWEEGNIGGVERRLEARKEKRRRSQELVRKKEEGRRWKKREERGIEMRKMKSEIWDRKRKYKSRDLTKRWKITTARAGSKCKSEKKERLFQLYLS